MNYLTNKTKPNVRERIMEHGMSFAFNEELVMLILGSGSKELPVEDMAMKIVEKIQDCNSEALIESLMKIKGVGKGKALQIASALELGKRFSNHLQAPIKSPADIVPFLKSYAVSTKEHFLAVTLNGSYEILQIRVVSVGTINRSMVHPREVFLEAIKENAAALIICHNHPSGTCTPSEDDIKTTETLMDCSKLLGIPIIDHIIVDRESYFSFLEHGLIKD